MAITAISRYFSEAPNLVGIISTNTLAEVAASGYITAQNDNITALNSGEWTWEDSDLVLVSASDGRQLFQFDDGDFATLVQLPGGNGEVTLPVVSGNFTVFDGTLGALKDAGYAPSDATKTAVVMANGAVVVNRLAKFTDTAGTVDDAASAATNLGDLYAGASGTAGAFRSYSSTAARGYLALVGVANTGDTAVNITNALHGQASTYTIPDGGQTASSFLITNSSGTQTIATGSVALTAGYYIGSAVNALTAHVGGGQGSATALTRQVNRVTTVASAADSVLLPAAIAGRVVTVINAAAANAMDVFPQTGEIINALSANTAISVAANKVINFYCAVAGTWNSLLTA